MRFVFAGAAVLVASTWAAHATPVDTGLWNADPTGSPACAVGCRASIADWSTPTSDSARSINNGYGTLTSNFTTDDTYVYSGQITPLGFDDDNIGAVVGWTDSNNNIRLGFEGGGFGDCGTDACPSPPYFAYGLWLVEEVAGTPTVLFEDASFAFMRGTTYDFSFTATGSALQWSFTDGTYAAGGTVNPTAPLAGAVGVWVGSQDAEFSSLSVTDTGTAVIPLPAGVWMMLSALGLLGAARARRKAA